MNEFCTSENDLIGISKVTAFWKNGIFKQVRGPYNVNAHGLCVKVFFDKIVFFFVVSHGVDIALFVFCRCVVINHIFEYAVHITACTKYHIVHFKVCGRHIVSRTGIGIAFAEMLNVFVAEPMILK